MTDEIPAAIREAFPNINLLIIHYQDCNMMGRCLVGGPMELRTLNSIFKQVAKDACWKLRFDPDRMDLLDYRNKGFIDFIRDPYPRGMATDVETLRKLLDAEASVLLEGLIPREQGGNNNPDGVNQYEKEAAEVNHSIGRVDLPPSLPPPQHGNTKEYTIRKLKRIEDGYKPKKAGPDFPTPKVATTLLARISAGELSCNAAMKEAGFRKDPTPLQVILRLLPKLDAHDLAATIQAARDRLTHGD